ncbi:endonuclease/exonuclease/phosphatase family protein [Sphingobacterium deserti]|uniref:Endonuclease/exonuclease/phosphatase n=1 Tax=Sphingobacterium deserti TaxID=1229276 RepID=A0A0B8T916_9SPHI|nr:endonuclease/exonuclease/phosphatase family protein [Sphingobacterium deserti]KGE14480.1 endonuclease/exonuclease/phosphatase [Sphingobacterium deserti]
MKKYCIIILLPIILLGIQSCRKSYDPGNWDLLPAREIEEPEPPSEGPSKTLKVMSINLRVGTANDFAVTREAIKEYNPDLLFLRQVDSATTRAEKVNRPQEIADALEMQLFFKKNFDFQTGGFGNAVLSKFPILEKHAQLLRREDGNNAELRSMVMIKVEAAPGQPLYFAGTELDPSNVNNRNLQVVDLLNATEKLVEPVILVGNFNEQEKDNGQVLSYLKGSFTFACLGAGCPLNSPKANPTGVFDYITFQDKANAISIGKYETFSKSGNTFLPMTAEFKLKLKEE